MASALMRADTIPAKLSAVSTVIERLNVEDDRKDRNMRLRDSSAAVRG
jgi:hypothetical protein